MAPATWEPPGQPPFVPGLWALGALVWAARLVPGFITLRRIARSGERWRAPAALDALRAAARLAGVTPPGTRPRSAHLPVPATLGRARPVHRVAAACTLERRVRALLATPGTTPLRPRRGVPLLVAGAVLMYALGTLAPCASGW